MSCRAPWRKLLLDPILWKIANAQHIRVRVSQVKGCFLAASDGKRRKLSSPKSTQVTGTLDMQSLSQRMGQSGGGFSHLVRFFWNPPSKGQALKFHHENIESDLWTGP
ncbi:hypothetical protein MPTK1_4g16120 [Marchantia polymorpha subsp. ruderalis]|uniref:Uncharacterized protein n=2 Tax=Marchantia polymorpha TaxID=3197 RepID=A0AAF6BAE7_MARPO|nr:hypothetical protein MARPO_0054s0077 [Marchantia polymorpha]BBN08981.1 hypothetical protein Mp_4g16120 [Marchantia polymorpha subsp. ruderalis]|eukprot:PTQ37968.1 hypothetical protein MARPO_0054s0077 [Marchantia polymorpha]